MVFPGIISFFKNDSLKSILYVCAAVLIVNSGVILAGWLLGITTLASYGQGFIPMAPVTAFLFLLQGVMLLLMVTRRSPVRAILALLVGSSALALLSGLLSVFYFSWEDVTEAISKMAIDRHILWISPLTALHFLLCGIAFFSLMRGSRVWSVLFILVVALSALAQVIAYLYGAPLYYGSEMIPPALPTSVAFLVLSLSLLLLWVRVFDIITPGSQRKKGVVLIGIVFAVLSAGLVATGYFIYQNYNQHLRQEAEAVLTLLGDMQTARIETWRSERLNDARVIQSQVYLHCQPDGDLMDQGQVLGLMYQSGEYDLLALADASGRQVRSMPAHMEPQARALLDRVPAGRKQELFFELYHNLPDSTVHLGMVLPLFCPTYPGQHSGYLIMRMNPRDFLLSVMKERIPLGPSAETRLIGHHRGHVLFLDRLLRPGPTALPWQLPVDSFPLMPEVMAVKGHTGIAEGQDYGRRRVLASLHKVSNSPWYVVASMNTSDIYMPMRRHLNRTVLLVLGLMAAAAFLLFYFWRVYQNRNLKKELEAERLLKRTLMELDFHVNNTSLGLIEWTPDFRVRRWSPQAQAMFGWTLAEVKGKTPEEWDFLYKEDAAVSVQHMHKLLSGEMSKGVFVTRHYTRGGEIIWCRWHSSVLKDEHGQILSILSLVQDITPEIKARMNQEQINLLLEKKVKDQTAQLRATVKELDAFSYSVSHDLRSPLLVVDGFSRMLQDDYARMLDEDGRQMLKSINANCRKMDQLISNLLQLSRTSREPLSKSAVDMKALALEVYHETTLGQQSPQAVLEMDELHPAAADPALIRQVWKNLLSNALKYSRNNPQPLIRVASRLENNFIVYSVEDNGAGFDPEQAHKLFTPFQRLHRPEEFEGTGVGLAIVQRIVHRHGGEVGAHAGENKGATIWFSLPAEEEEGERG